MSARACQLCGKPLSRFSVGTDGDFCSREHRNQYRLRQGMGRLQEANKVANVMRRREQLRPLVGARRGPSPEMPQRGCFRLPFPTRHPQFAAGAIELQQRPLRVGSRADHFIAPPPASSVRAAVPKASPAASVRTRRQPVLPRRKSASQPGGIQQAPLSSLPTLANGTVPPQHEFGLALPKPRRPLAGRRRDPKQAAQLPGARIAGNRSRSKPVRGTTLRVSCACGFRARLQRRVFPSTSGRFQAQLRWCEGTTRSQAKQPQKAHWRAVDGIAIPVGGIYCPAAPAQPAAGPQAQRRAKPMPRPAPSGGVRLRPRAADKELNLQSAAFLLRDPVFEPWRAGSMSAPSNVSTKPAAIAGRGASQHLLVSFVPQDMSRDFSFSVGQNGNKDQKR